MRWCMAKMAERTSTVAPAAGPCACARAATPEVAVQGSSLVTPVLGGAHVAGLSRAHVTAATPVQQAADARLTPQLSGVALTRGGALGVALDLATHEHMILKQ